MTVKLDNKHKIVEKTDRFVHTIKCIYPKENVATMINGWKEKIQEGKEWLEKFEEMKETTIAEGFNQIDVNIEKREKALADFDAMSDEDKFKKLLETQEKNRVELLKSKADIELTKTSLKKQLEEELGKYRAKIQHDIAEKSNALNLWTNPVQKR